MQVTPENLSILRESLLRSTSPENVVRKQAEATLKNCENQSGFATLLLTLISQLTPDSGALVEMQLASIIFKNLIKKYWDPDEEDKADLLTFDERGKIKTHIIDLMCSTPIKIQSQLAEAVSIIAHNDFPGKWESLLPHLVSKLPSTDLKINQGVMLTANSIMKRFRHVDKSDEILSDLVVCLTNFQEPLLQMYKHNATSIEANVSNPSNLLSVFETHRLMTRIFFSLNFLELPEYFEDHIQDWMSEFSKFLSYSNPSLPSPSSDEPGPIEKLKSAILENLNLYASKYEEEFAAFLGPFTQQVWQLLMEAGPEPKYDSLAISSIKFLTSVGSKKMNSSFFSEQVLRDVVQHIVIGNISCTAQDEENIDLNPTDYIRKDIEGSDQDTRRRSAMELVRTLRTFFEEFISQLCLQLTASMLHSYTSSGKKEWRMQDAALHLILACSVNASNASVGAATLNPSFSLPDIFRNFILPEITDPDTNSRPIVKATALKMILTYRSHIDQVFLTDLLPHLIRLLGSGSVVIQTYSSMAIERFLALKDGPSPRISKATLQPHLEALFVGLFQVLENPELPENDYVMKCIMRLLVSLGPDTLPILPQILSKLSAALERVCRQPTNPQYNHYLWEAFSVLVRGTCGSTQLPPSDPPSPALTLLAQFESFLFPIFQQILANDVSEFVAYVFQVLAQTLSLRPQGSGLTPPYLTLLPPMLTPAIWENKPNVPALATLLKAYIVVGGREVVGEASQLQAILGIFQKLISAKSTQPQAFLLLDALLLHAPPETLSPHLSVLFSLLLRYMQDAVKRSKTAPYCRSFLHTLSLSISIFSPQAVFSLLESLTPNLSTMLVLNVLGTNRQELSVYGTDTDLGHMIVGFGKFLTLTAISTSLASDASAVETWRSLFLSVLLLVGVVSGVGIEAGAIPSRRKPTTSTLSAMAFSLMNDTEEGPKLSEEAEGVSKLIFAQVTLSEAALNPILTTEFQSPLQVFSSLLSDLVKAQPAFRDLIQQTVATPLQIGTTKVGFIVNTQQILSTLH